MDRLLTPRQLEDLLTGRTVLDKKDILRVLKKACILQDAKTHLATIKQRPPFSRGDPP